MTEMEKSRSVDQRTQRLEQFWLEHAHRLPRQGAVVATYRWRGGIRVGPYFSLSSRDELGRQRAVYLGPASALVEEVRNRLAAAQQTLRTRRTLQRVRRELRRAQRAAQAELAANLAGSGLRLQGLEFRGWRQFSRAAEPLSGALQAPPLPPPAAPLAPPATKEN
jgi:hypothetical protein